MNIIKQLELDLGLLSQNISQTSTPDSGDSGKTGTGNTTEVTKNTSKDVKNKTSTPEDKLKNSAYPFDETGRRILKRRPRLEKDYQKDLTFYLTKAGEYLPWRFYVEFRVDFQGKLGFIDLVLKTEHPQHLLIELKKGTINVEIMKEILERNYIEAYKQRIKNTKYPLLYIIGEDFTQEAQQYSDVMTQQLKQQSKRCKYKPKVVVRTYLQLMEFLDSQLSQTEITNFEFIRLQRNCPLLYESKIPLL